MNGTIPDPIVFEIKRPPAPPHTLSVPRNVGESEEDHVRRACRQLLTWLENNPSPQATSLACKELGIELDREEEQTNEQFVADFCGLLEELIPD